MSLFNKKDGFEQETEKAEKEVVTSIIDQKMTFKGELSFTGKARVDGTIEGNIKGEHLILSQSGKIIGDVVTTSLVCHGTIEGNTKVNLLTARKNCQIHGKIEANSLTVEPGAGLSGEIKVASQKLHLIETGESNTKLSTTKSAQLLAQ